MKRWSEMKPRERDALVHTRAMGRNAVWVASEPPSWEKDENGFLGFKTNFGGAVFTADRDWLANDYIDPDENRAVPPYTSDIAAAWQVVERMRERGFVRFSLSTEGGRWFAEFGTDQIGKGFASRRVAAEAICDAALEACGGVVE